MNHSLPFACPLRILLLCLSLGALASCRSDEKVPIHYSFFVAGHSYGAPGRDSSGLHPPFLAKFDELKEDETVEFGVLTGDIVIGSTPQNWDEVDRDLGALDMPVYFALGNHDSGNPGLTTRRYGSSYFSFRKGEDLILVLDPNLDHWRISGAQLDFLKNELGMYREMGGNIFVFFHQLLWWEPEGKFSSILPNSLEGRADSINFRTEIEPLFRTMQHRVYFFAGDIGAIPDRPAAFYHQYEHFTYIASGMGAGESDNFLLVDVMEDGSVEFTLVALNQPDPGALGRLEDFGLKR